jgi:hypothetical protein
MIMQIRKHRRVRTPSILYSVPHLSDILAANDETEKNTLEMLINEFQTLKTRCDTFQNEVDDLKCRCNSYEALSERNRQVILQLLDRQGQIDTNYNGETFDLM